MSQDDAVRYKIFLFLPCILQWWITQGAVLPANEVTVVTGIPAGARFVRGFYDGENNRFGAVFEHESFDLVADGARIPVVDVVLSTRSERHED